MLPSVECSIHSLQSIPAQGRERNHAKYLFPACAPDLYRGTYLGNADTEKNQRATSPDDNGNRETSASPEQASAGLFFFSLSWECTSAHQHSHRASCLNICHAQIPLALCLRFCHYPNRSLKKAQHPCRRESAETPRHCPSHLQRTLPSGRSASTRHTTHSAHSHPWRASDNCSGQSSMAHELIADDPQRPDSAAPVLPGPALLDQLAVGRRAWLASPLPLLLPIQRVF